MYGTLPVYPVALVRRYVVETRERPSTMTLTCRDCDGTVEFWNPSADRVDWFAGSHRCGGQGWQEPILVDYSDDEPIPFDIVDRGASESGPDGCEACRVVGPLLTGPGTSGRVWTCSCGRTWGEEVGR